MSEEWGVPELGYPERMMLEANGLRFSGLSAGPEDGEPVLLLHGFPQFADAWTGLMSRLAEAGYRVVAVDQRGYSTGARPAEVKDYAVETLTADVLGFAAALGVSSFHLVGHDWGGLVAWKVAAMAADRVLSLTVLSTPHPDAFFKALTSDPDQMKRSAYLALFRAPFHAAEMTLLALDAKILRGVYQGKLPEAQVEENVRRFTGEGTLTFALNWYRALDFGDVTGPVKVPTTYVWGDQDIALGETAALATAGHVTGPYRFVRVAGGSHWLVEDRPEEITSVVLDSVRQGGKQAR